MTSSVTLFDQRREMSSIPNIENLDISYRERWAPIAESPGYVVSTDGRVRFKEFDVATWRNKKGYICVSIVLPDGRPVLRYVHRLMLAAFVEPPDGRIANHEDGQKGRNVLDNLEWTTHSGNVTHAWQLRRQARYRELGEQMRSLFEELDGQPPA